MPETVSLLVNGTSQIVPSGTVVSVAMMLAHKPTRISLTGQPRSAMCGMGICFECRAIVNGTPHTRTCQLICEDGMIVETNP